MKNFKPHGEMVLIEFVESEAKEGDKDSFKLKGSLLVKKEDVEKKQYEARVSAIGSGVDVSKITYAIGDKVIYNDYDTLKFAGDNDTTWGICKSTSIWASYD